MVAQEHKGLVLPVGPRSISEMWGREECPVQCARRWGQLRGRRQKVVGTYDGQGPALRVLPLRMCQDLRP